jgi:uncharacterized membrane protein
VSPRESSTAWQDADVTERPRRSREEWALLWAKSVTWRFISTGLLFFIAWAVTGSWSTGGLVAVIHMAVTIVIYVPHDLAWERYGRSRTSRRQSGVVVHNTPLGISPTKAVSGGRTSIDPDFLHISNPDRTVL